MRTAVLCVAGVLAWGAAAAGAQQAVPVAVAVARQETVEEWVEGTGTLRAFQTARIVPKVSGSTVQEVLVNEGDRVRAGQVLVRLDSELIRAQIDGTRARLGAVKAQIQAVDARIRMLRTDAERARNLVKQGVSPRQQLDHLEAQLDAARAERDALEAQEKALGETLRELELRLSYHTVTAPWDGVVLERHTDPGDVAAPGRPVITLGVLQRLKLRVTLAEVDYPRVRPGQAARVVVDAVRAEPFGARVDRVLPGLDPATHTGQVEIHLDAAGTRLRPGMFARARIRVGTHRGTLIPRDALRKVPGSGVWFVYVAAQGKAQRRDVTLGAHLGTRVEVLSGVEPGEAVVVRGEGVVRTGTPVRVVEKAEGE